MRRGKSKYDQRGGLFGAFTSSSQLHTRERKMRVVCHKIAGDKSSSAAPIKELGSPESEGNWGRYRSSRGDGAAKNTDSGV